jgi:hypothetical protein
MTDPVVAEDGHTYQQQAIEAWIAKCTSGTSNVGTHDTEPMGRGIMYLEQWLQYQRA